jgi:hypothetical protein
MFLNNFFKTFFGLTFSDFAEQLRRKNFRSLYQLFIFTMRVRKARGDLEQLCKLAPRKLSLWSDDVAEYVNKKSSDIILEEIMPLLINSTEQFIAAMKTFLVDSAVFHRLLWKYAEYLRLKGQKAKEIYEHIRNIGLCHCDCDQCFLYIAVGAGLIAIMPLDSFLKKFCPNK